MKKITFLLLFVAPFVLKGQTNDSIKSKKINVGFTYSPEYDYRSTSVTSDLQSMKSAYDTLEIPKFGYSYGVNAIYTISTKFAVSLGFLYSDKGEQLKQNSFLTYGQYKNHYNYLEIPVRLNYSIIQTQSKFNFYATAGISVNSFLNHKITYIQNGSATADGFMKGNSSTIVKTNLGYTVGIGVDCPLTEKWYFKAEFSYKRFLNSMASNSNLKRYLYSFGPTVGLYYRL